MRNWLIATLLAFNVYADEGMWQPHQLPLIGQDLTDNGLEIDPNKLTKFSDFPLNAVVSLGGCSASFVSPQGLVVTNHHCAYGSIQYNSTADKNLLQNGFLAKTYAQELPAAPGSRIYVTQSMLDVTQEMTRGLSAKSGKAYFEEIENRKKTLVAECESDASVRCQVHSLHHGLAFSLVKQLAIKDVRLVYAPTVSVGLYGGDIDNWMWPRHTGDFAFYRAYVAPDGKPAPYHKDNKPYQPKGVLKVSAQGVRQGDFVMVAGYPGSTNRYRTAFEVSNQFNVLYPQSKALREALISIIKLTATEGSDARIKYETTLAGLANYAKNYGAMMEFYDKSSMLTKKRAAQAALHNWINEDVKRAQSYGTALGELEAIIAQQQQFQQRDLILGYMRYVSLFNTANQLYRLAHEQQKPDEQRKPGYQLRDMPKFTASLKRLDRRFDPKVDKAMFELLLTQYTALDQSERLKDLDKAFSLPASLEANQLKVQLDKLYDNTQLDKEAVRLAWMNKSVADFQQSDDAFIQLAVKLYDMNLALEDERDRLSGKLMQWRPKYMAAVIAYQQSLGKAIYADANSSLRVSTGKVDGYHPEDGMYALAFTQLEGILAKNTGVAPFDVSDEQQKLIKQKHYGRYAMKALGSVPVNFLSTLDTTGGNSGSPVLNAQGELVGLLFDGVYESIIGDWDYDERTNRSIQVDSRYMLWVLDYLDNANNLIEEMLIVD